MSEVETYSFGEWLKQQRRKLRLTQRELAATVHCSPAMLKKIEADERHPSFELAELLADALKISESDQETFIEVARGERPVDFLTPSQAGATVTPAPPFRAPDPLPKPVTPFVGRVDELAEINERLLNPDCRLLTLLGPGGIGKTRLAIAVGHAQKKAFIDGVVFVSLATITDTNLIPDTIAISLRLALSGPPAEQVLAYLRRRNLLLVLDNCEQLNGDLIWLSDLLTQAAGIKLLATSRERLRVAEEWVFAVPELAQAVALFAETARRVKQDFDLEREKEAVTHICQLVENLPLAIELAAGWAPLMSCAQIAAHIQRDIDMLATDTRNVPEPHRSIRAIFNHSWNLLSSAEQNALMRLSVFRGGWQAEEALSVAGANLLLLRRLVEKSLVRVGAIGRYDLHELTRQYAAEKLALSGAEAETRQQHFDAYLALAAQLDARQFRPHSMEVLTRFDQEQDNIRAALAWILKGKQTELSLRLLYHLSFYYIRRGYLREGEQWAIRAIHQVGESESTLLCQALGFAAGVIFFQGRYGEAHPLALRALAMARRLEDPETIITAYLNYNLIGVNVEQALTGLHEGLALIQETGKLKHLLAPYYVSAGTWFQSSGRYAEANDYYRKALALYRQADAVDLTVDVLSRLGQVALQDGRLQDAYELTIESMAAAREVGYFLPFGAGGSTHLGIIQLYLGEIDAAERSLQESLLWFEDDRHDARGRQETLAFLSEVALARGDVGAAVDHLQASLNICQMFYRQLQATQKLEGTPDAMPVDVISLCARASLVAAAQRHDERAVTLCSIADALRTKSRQIMIPPLQARLDEGLSSLRDRLSENDFEIAWEAGQSMTLSEVFAFLLT